MNIKTRFTIFLGGLFFLTTIITWTTSSYLTNKINNIWAENYLEKHVEFDKNKTLTILLKEIELARKMAQEKDIINFAVDGEDPKVQKKAFQKLDKYRELFKDKTYFIALFRSGEYFFKKDLEEKKYFLNKDKKEDSWFFTTLKSNKEYNINVSKDEYLDVTSVWINVVIKNEKGENIGVVGTGFDLQKIINEFSLIDTKGIDHFLVDENLGIQLIKSVDLIDQASFTRIRNKNILNLINEKNDLEEIKKSMVYAKENQEIKFFKINIKDVKHIVGVSYIKELNWYSITLINDNLLYKNNNIILPTLLTILFLIAIVFMYIMINKSILYPIKKIKELAIKIENGNFDNLIDIETRDNKDEIKELSEKFNNMSKSLKKHNLELDLLIEEKTKNLTEITNELLKKNEDLNMISRTDALTEIDNRLSIMEKLAVEASRSKRNLSTCGIIMIDIDHFKQINDKYGHYGGDIALKKIAMTIKKTIRAEDVVGRWGGEEFIVLLPNQNIEGTIKVAEKIKKNVNETQIIFNNISFSVTLSQGVYYYNPQNHIEMEGCIENADKALYLAKNNGRDQIKSFE